MDFYNVKTKPFKNGTVDVYPEFTVKRSKDLMVRGTRFYAVWDKERGMWSTDDYDVQRLVDEDLFSYASEMDPTLLHSIKTMQDFSTGSWASFKNYVASLSDNSHPLDRKITFSNEKITRTDYVSHTVPYPLEKGDYSAFDELIGTLYLPEEREKIEWAIGAIVSGESVDIQKFVVLYGDAGTGKSTILNIIQMLFPGYYAIFDAKALATNGNVFATEVLKSNPMIAIQHDGDLSKIENNSLLNSIISHEEITINEKHKSMYSMRMDCFLFMATNSPVKITDAKSGIIRRLIDVHPSGNKLDNRRYNQLMKKIQFELSAIAYHCLEVYRTCGKNYYASYKPIDMMFKTDVFYNFVDENYFLFLDQNGTSLKAAFNLYKDYCDETAAGHVLPMYKFREELKNYFDTYYDRMYKDGKQVRSWFSDFKTDKFPQYQDSIVEDAKTDRSIKIINNEKMTKDDIPKWLNLNCKVSILDEILKDYPAQYTKKDEYGNDIPKYPWSKVNKTLKDIDTHKVHYIGRVPIQLICIDFDLKDENGDKSSILNIESASNWPETYAEYSKSGQGLHLYYWYVGDVTRLKLIFSEGVEIKVFKGLTALRRKLTYCNDTPIATIYGGLPMKGERVVNSDSVKSEKGLRKLIERHLAKEIVPSTRQSIDLIYNILNDAYDSGLVYDVTDMRNQVLIFASKSSHQAKYCIKKIGDMRFKSEDESQGIEDNSDSPIVFFDIEIFPDGIVDGDYLEGLFIINWKYNDVNSPVVRMINPKPEEVRELLKYKLVGFNCRRYDNHIVYAYAYEDYTIPELYSLSKRLIGTDSKTKSSNAFFKNAYNLSYTDIYDFCSKKQSLKKWEIELGIHHQELGLPWDKPVPKDRWLEVAEYCDNDVIATEALFNARQPDWTARKILASVADLTVNDTTNSLTTKIIFENDKNPQKQFEYRFMGIDIDNSNLNDIYAVDTDTFEKITDFNKIAKIRSFTLFDVHTYKPVFPGYCFEKGESTYRGEIIGEGGYVYSTPGMYRHVALLDIASMHPSSIIAEDFFGKEYTKRFADIVNARISIKHKDFEAAKKILDGKLAPFLDDQGAAKDLAGALKIAINSVYGLTSASFVNPFKDPRNVDNLVAKRGALFMVNLKHEVQRRGFIVAHIKTDSIKIPDATPEIIEFVKRYGKLYGYNFEHEATYDRMCLVNDAVYIAKYDNEGIRDETDEKKKHRNEWTATGTEFQIPYVFKTLFSHEPIDFKDLCETKTVTTSLYLDLNEGLPDVSESEKALDDIYKELKKNNLELDEATQKQIDILKEHIATGHNYHFIGKAGLFTPVIPGCNGGDLVREKDGKYYSATGAKGYKWLESEMVEQLGMEDKVNIDFYEELAMQAKIDISKYGSFEEFVSSEFLNSSDSNPPWNVPCGDNRCETCIDCPKCKLESLEDSVKWICERGYSISPNKE